MCASVRAKPGRGPAWTAFRRSALYHRLRDFTHSECTKADVITTRFDCDIRLQLDRATTVRRLRYDRRPTAARLITGTRKFNSGLSDLLHSELHWLDIYRRVQYKLGVAIYRCLQNRAPQYLVDCCVRTSDVSSRQRLWSANRRQLESATTSSQQVRTSIVLRCSSDGLELVSGLSSGSNAEHRQLQIDIKDSSVRGATGHVAH